MSYDGRSRSVPPTIGRWTGVEASPPSEGATKSVAPFPETAAVRRGDSLTARERMEKPGRPRGPLVGASGEAPTSTTRPLRRPQGAAFGGPAASNSLPLVTEASIRPLASGTGAP